MDNSYRITKDMQLVTSDKREIKVDQKTLKVTPSSKDKHLVIVFGFLNAKQKFLMKYADFYLEQDFDVILITVQPLELMCPKTDVLQVAKDLSAFLLNNDFYQKLFIHGFSVGTTLYGDCLIYMRRDLEKYQKVIDRFAGQVWDSPGTKTVFKHGGHLDGVSSAVCTNHPTLQAILRFILNFYMKIIYLVFGLPSLDKFEENMIRAPALVFTSKTDNVCRREFILKDTDIWVKKNNMDVTVKCFEDSGHVRHFVKYKEEYLSALRQFFEAIEANKLQDSFQPPIRSKI